MTTAKHKRIHLYKDDGRYETEDTRYNLKCSIKKVIKFCLAHDFSFKVGFRGNTLIRNKNYIEIIDDAFVGYNEKKIVNQRRLENFLSFHSESQHYQGKNNK